MSTVPQVKLAVRRALEAALKAMADAHVPPIKVEYPDLAFDRNTVSQFYRIDVHYGPPAIRTQGNNPRIDMSGYAAIGVYTKIGSGLDANDTLAALLGPVYPYDANLAFEGVSVNISTLETRDGAEIDSWRFTPIIVNWTVWRVA